MVKTWKVFPSIPKKKRSEDNLKNILGFLLLVSTKLVKSMVLFQEKLRES